MIQGALDRLAADLGDLDGVNHAQVWQGEWDALESGGQISFQSPAVFVSLVEFGVVDVAQTVRGRGRLAADPAPPRAVPAAGARTIAFRPDGDVRATADVEIAVTCVVSGSTAAGRAETALDLAARAIPVMIGHALRRISGSNLDSAALRGRGQSAVVLIGTRAVQLDPPPAARQTLARVDVVSGAGAGAGHETVFGGGE